MKFSVALQPNATESTLTNFINEATEKHEKPFSVWHSTIQKTEIGSYSRFPHAEELRR